MSPMDPEVALTRWCPFATSQIPVVDKKTVTAIGATAGNRIPNTSGDPDRDCLCIASRCMAWRWSDNFTGYCGLAGRPIDNKETPT